MKYFYSIIVLALCLSSCISKPSNLIKGVQCDQKNKYCIDFGSSMNERSWTDDWTDSEGKSTDHTITNGTDTYDSKHFRADFYSFTSCPLSGVSKPNSISPDSGIMAEWGVVDFWSKRKHVMDIQDEYPFCRPLSFSTAYAFCAEKNGKAVTICIQQMTDDEAMVKAIFESFRWTD